MTNSMPDTSAAQLLSVDLKRQVVYASLLRFAGEAQHMRNRVIDRLVLAALSETDHDHPLKIGEIQKAITVGGSAQIRIEPIQDALQRLQRLGFVDQRRIRLKRTHFLSERGQQEIRGAATSGMQLLDAVLARNMRGLPAGVSSETAAAVFRRFLAECFARLGLEIAKTVTGRIERDDLVRMPQIAAGFNVACQGHELSAHARESLESRCSEFLRSSHFDDERLKLYLTQAYFFTQLLGMQGVRFDPLAEQAFAGAVLYLDTNTLLPRLLQSEAAPMFDEMVSVAKQLGIDLRVTRATLNETRRVAADRQQQLRKIVEKGVPDELMQRVNDQFMEGFVERRDRENVTLEEFFAPFERLSELVQHDLGITLVDITEEEMLTGHADASDVGRMIQEESEAIRRRKKSPGTLEHDVAHLVMVDGERRDQPKTWFLTNDRSVMSAATRLVRGNEPPVCFGLTGFLQTLSPFVTNGGAEHSLADMFSSMLSDQFASTDHAYDVEELVVLADLHEDVLATRDEKLVQAIDVVKARVLRGQPFRAENAQQNALELKKFLASSAGERERAAVGERERLRGEVAQSESQLEGERQRRSAIEDDAKALRDQVAGLEDEIGRLLSADRANRTAVERLNASLAAHERRAFRNRAIIASVAGVALVVWDTEVAGTLNSRIPALGPYWEYLLRALRVVGLLLMALPWTVFIRSSNWRDEYRIGALTLLYACVYALFPGVTDGWNTIVADPLVWVALIVSILLARR
jgi:hypothetical protein